MTKEEFLDEVRRIAQENNGTPPGSRAFYAQTGTRESRWKGKSWNEWNSWNDILGDAGFTRRGKTPKIDGVLLLDHLAALTNKLGRFPITLDMRREKRANPLFPNDKTFLSSFGGRERVLEALKMHCQKSPNFSNIRSILESTVVSGAFKPRGAVAENEDDCEELAENGYVYLMKSHDVYKVGSTRAPYRRAAEIANQSARGAELLHLISTDDPEGIERYWHSRFKSKAVQAINKASGEWFHLNAGDVKAFKKRKSM